MNLDEISAKKAFLMRIALLSFFLKPFFTYFEVPYSGFLLFIPFIIMPLLLEQRFFKRDIFYFQIYFVFIAAISTLLYLGQDDLLYSPRPIFLYFGVVFFVLFIAAASDYSDSLLKNIYDVIFVSMLTEAILVILQFSYSVSGFGIQPKLDEIYGVELVSGSYGNGNNAAVVLLLSYILLSIKKYSKFSILWPLAFPLVALAIFLTLSRTALLIFFIFIIRDLWVGRSLKIVPYIIAAIGFFKITIFDWIIENADNSIISRSLDRFSSIEHLGSDESAGFRLISLQRLFENIGNLGLGSLKDLTYFEYFRSDDDFLMSSNPHSYITEISFLFGYPGFISTVIFLFFVYINIRKNIEGSVYYHIFLFVGLFLLTMIPSSIIGMPTIFFCLVVLSRMRPLVIKG